MLTTKLQSIIKIHLWKLNSYIYNAWISSTTFSAASIRFIFLLFLSLDVNICMRIAMSPGHIDLNILLRELCDSLIKRILIQNSISISKAGEVFYYFITSLRNSRTVLSLFSYLSTLPE